MVAGRPSIIIRPEIYVTATAVSASLTVAGTMISLDNALVWILAWLAGFLLRSAAIRWQLALPAHGRTARYLFGSARRFARLVAIIRPEWRRVGTGCVSTCRSR